MRIRSQICKVAIPQTHSKKTTLTKVDTMDKMDKKESEAPGEHNERNKTIAKVDSMSGKRRRDEDPNKRLCGANPEADAEAKAAAKTKMRNDTPVTAKRAKKTKFDVALALCEKASEEAVAGEAAEKAAVAARGPWRPWRPEGRVKDEIYEKVYHEMAPPSVQHQGRRHYFILEAVRRHRVRVRRSRRRRWRRRGGGGGAGHRQEGQGGPEAKKAEVDLLVAAEEAAAVAAEEAAVAAQVTAKRAMEALEAKAEVDLLSTRRQGLRVLFMPSGGARGVDGRCWAAGCNRVCAGV